MNRILVTGATGFLGRAIVREALAQSIAVRATGRRSTPDTPLSDYIQADLCEGANCRKLLDGVDCVIHAAGLAHQFRPEAEPLCSQRFQEINVHATVKLAEEAANAGVRRFVYVSSVSVYGSSTNGSTATTGVGVVESTPTVPDGPYARSKWEAEQRLIDLARRTEMDIVILRMATLYGENDPGNMLRLIRSIDGGRFVWIGRGDNLKSLIDRDDAARACLMAATQHPKSEQLSIYNVVGTTCPMRDVVGHVYRCLKKSEPRIRIPAGIVTTFLTAAAKVSVLQSVKRLRQTVRKWLAHDAYDGTAFCHDFGFRPLVSLADGLLREVDWYRSRSDSRDVKIESRSSFSKPLPVADLRGQTMKRAFDISFALMLTFVLAVPMLLIALAVRLTSRGPAVYWSDRVGLDNVIFSMPKFRTMRTDTPEVATHELFDCHRWITPLGRILRKTSLDELPQLWSILKGDLSFVGPRPALYNQDDLISLRTEQGVHKLIPGLTGWAQINGRDDLSSVEKVAFDVMYLSHRTFLWDLKIIAVTLLKVTSRDGVKQTDDKDRGDEMRRAA